VFEEHYLKWGGQVGRVRRGYRVLGEECCVRCDIVLFFHLPNVSFFVRPLKSAFDCQFFFIVVNLLLLCSTCIKSGVRRFPHFQPNIGIVSISAQYLHIQH
jgi:hypothetical protein